MQVLHSQFALEGAWVFALSNPRLRDVDPRVLGNPSSETHATQKKQEASTSYI